MQREIAALVTPGLDFRALHLATHRKVAELLVDSELASGDVDELLERRVTSAFFPHGLGHYIGLQVHDVAGLSGGPEARPIERPAGHAALRLTRQLETRQVLTIEPGIYFIPMLLDELRADRSATKLVNWPAVATMIPFGGIRIEDDVHVLEDGAENLTRDAFVNATTAH